MARKLKKALEGQAVPVGHGETDRWSYSKPAVVKASKYPPEELTGAARDGFLMARLA